MGFEMNVDLIAILPVRAGKYWSASGFIEKDYPMAFVKHDIIDGEGELYLNASCVHDLYLVVLSPGCYVSLGLNLYQVAMIVVA